MKKINSKYIIAAAIIAIVIIIVIIVGVSKGKDKQTDEGTQTGTNIEETVESNKNDSMESESNEIESTDETVELIIQDIDPETGKPIDITENTQNKLSPEEIKAKQEEIDKINQEKINKLKEKVEKEGDSVSESLPNEIKEKLNDAETVNIKDDATIKSIGNTDSIMDIEGNKVSFESLSIPVHMSENIAKHPEERENGLKYWWIYNFMPGDEVSVIKVYTELRVMKGENTLEENIFSLYPTFKDVSFTYKKEITNEIENTAVYGDYTVYKYTYTTSDNCNITNTYIIPNTSLLNIDDEYRVYSISINNTDKLGLSDAIKTLEDEVNKLLGANDFKLN